MNIKDLAEALRQRQRQIKFAPEGFINALSDERMLWCYITCVDCGKRFIEEEDLANMIADAKDVDDFLRLRSMAERHNHSRTLQ